MPVDFAHPDKTKKGHIWFYSTKTLSRWFSSIHNINVPSSISSGGCISVSADFQLWDIFQLIASFLPEWGSSTSFPSRFGCQKPLPPDSFCLLQSNLKTFHVQTGETELWLYVFGVVFTVVFISVCNCVQEQWRSVCQISSRKTWQNEGFVLLTLADLSSLKIKSWKKLIFLICCQRMVGQWGAMSHRGLQKIGRLVLESFLFHGLFCSAFYKEFIEESASLMFLGFPPNTTCYWWSSPRSSLVYFFFH
jgi:hypothetical protein